MKKFVILSLLVVSCGASSVNALPNFLMSKEAKAQRSQERYKAMVKEDVAEINRRMIDEEVFKRSIGTGTKAGLGFVAASYVCSLTGGCATVCAVVPVTWPVLIPTVLAASGAVGVTKYALEFRKINVDVTNKRFFKK